MTGKKCGDCIHANICKKVNSGWFSPKNIAYCKAFKDSANFVEVVHCKDCQHWVRTENGGYCDNPDGLLGVDKPNDFCPYGERRVENG